MVTVEKYKLKIALVKNFKDEFKTKWKKGIYAKENLQKE